MSIAIGRLAEEMKQWKYNHPRHFSAKLTEKLDGTPNYLYWECSIPGEADTPWEGGQYYISLEFDMTYPDTPPKAQFSPPIFHPNVFPSGTIALSILSGDVWYPQITVRDVLVGCQRLLQEPNLKNPANSEAYTILMGSTEEYNEIIRLQAEEFSLEYDEEEEDY